MISNKCVKTGVHLKAVFPPLNLGLMRISRSHFKQSKTLCSKQKSMVLRSMGYFWEEIVFLKGLVKFGEIRNIEDLFCF